MTYVFFKKIIRKEKIVCKHNGLLTSVCFAHTCFRMLLRETQQVLQFSREKTPWGKFPRDDNLLIWTFLLETVNKNDQEYKDNETTNSKQDIFHCGKLPFVLIRRARLYNGWLDR